MNSFPVIAWKNLLTADPGPEITHSDDADGHPFQNIGDWRDYTVWTSSESGDLFVKLDASGLEGQAMSADTLAIAGHNLSSAGVSGLALYYSDDDVDYTPCFPALDPVDDRVIFKSFARQSRRYFRLVIPSGYTTPPRIGVLFIGEAMIIPNCPDAGFDPDSQQAELAVEYSRTGRLLGVAERFRRREIKAAFKRLPASFISGEWSAFWNQHGTLPFFFAWDPEGRPGESYLVRLSSPGWEAPYDRAFRSLALTMTGLVEQG